MSLIAGIDEAGRGSVIGPLVVCCASCRREDERKLRSLCKKDSKQLTAPQRVEVYAKLKPFVTFRWVEISASDLNVQMREMSLNDIEAKAMSDLAKPMQDADVMIDMPDRYSWTFRKRMERFGLKRFEAEHKADETYPIVAAASICAKIMRDTKVAQIREKTCDFGSGYPSDPKTREALKGQDTRKALGPFVRERWKTLETIKQRKLFEGDAPPEGEAEAAVEEAEAAAEAAPGTGHGTQDTEHKGAAAGQ